MDILLLLILFPSTRYFRSCKYTLLKITIQVWKIAVNTFFEMLYFSKVDVLNLVLQGLKHTFTPLNLP